MFLVFNQGMPRTHLWYLRAFLYVLIVMYYVDKYNKKELVYKLIPILLCGNLILGKYSLLLFGIEFEAPIARNWLFTGLPFYAIGMWVRENMETIRSRLQNKGKAKLLSLIAVFSLTSITERYILKLIVLNTEIDYTLSTAFLAIVVFLYFLFYVDQKDNVFSYIGRVDSTGIYILHPIFVTIFPILIRNETFLKYYTFCKAIIIFVITLATVELFNRLKRKFNRLKQKLFHA